MPRDYRLIIGIIAIVAIMAGNYYSGTKSQATANERIASLEAEIESLKTQKKEEPKPQAQPKQQFMSEEELLASFFAENPTMISPEMEENLAKIEVKSGPVLSVTPEVFDLGQISKKNGLAEASYTLKNEGDKALTISYAFSSCGCTVAPLKEEKILEPGESYALDVSYDPNYYGPNHELGNIEKTVTILSNYVKKPFYKVKLKAEVTP